MPHRPLCHPFPFVIVAAVLVAVDVQSLLLASGYRNKELPPGVSRIPKQVESGNIEAEPQSLDSQKPQDNLLFESMKVPNYKNIDLEANQNLTDGTDDLEQKVSPKVLERG